MFLQLHLLQRLCVICSSGFRSAKRFKFLRVKAQDPAALMVTTRNQKIFFRMCLAQFCFRSVRLHIYSLLISNFLQNSSRSGSRSAPERESSRRDKTDVCEVPVIQNLVLVCGEVLKSLAVPRKLIQELIFFSLAPCGTKRPCHKQNINPTLGQKSKSQSAPLLLHAVPLAI